MNLSKIPGSQNNSITIGFIVKRQWSVKWVPNQQTAAYFTVENDICCYIFWSNFLKLCSFSNFFFILKLKFVAKVMNKLKIIKKLAIVPALQIAGEMFWYIV